MKVKIKKFVDVVTPEFLGVSILPLTLGNKRERYKSSFGIVIVNTRLSNKR